MIILHPSATTVYLRKYEGMYPGIERWWECRVVPDIEMGIKMLFRFDRDFDIQALGIIDLFQGKLCHLSLEHAVRGSGLGRSILNIATKALREAGHSSLWCHGPERMAADFCRWSGAAPVRALGNFGRAGEKDVLMTLQFQADRRSKDGQEKGEA